jgi:hypothetical protein
MELELGFIKQSMRSSTNYLINMMQVCMTVQQKCGWQEVLAGTSQGGAKLFFWKSEDPYSHSIWFHIW